MLTSVFELWELKAIGFVSPRWIGGGCNPDQVIATGGPRALFRVHASMVVHVCVLCMSVWMRMCEEKKEREGARFTLMPSSLTRPI